MFARVATVIALGIAVGFLSVIVLMYQSVDNLNNNLTTASEGVVTSIQQGSGTLSGAMNLVPGQASLPEITPTEVKPSPQGQDEAPMAETGTEEQTLDEATPESGSEPLKEPTTEQIPIPNLPRDVLRTGQILKYDGYNWDTSPGEALIDAGALEKIYGMSGLPDNESRSDLVFYAPAEDKDKVKEVYQNVQTLSSGEPILLYEVWNNIDEPLPVNIPENYRLDYISPGTLNPASDQRDAYDPNQYYGYYEHPFYKAGPSRFGELDQEWCKQYVEQKDGRTTEDCESELSLYQPFIPTGQHDRVVVWAKALEYVRGEEAHLFWRLVPEYTETKWAEDSEGSHSFLRYYQGGHGPPVILPPSTFKLTEAVPTCGCVKASQHGEVIEWFTAHKAVENPGLRLFWVPIWDVK